MSQANPPPLIIASRAKHRQSMQDGCWTTLETSVAKSSATAAAKLFDGRRVRRALYHIDPDEKETPRRLAQRPLGRTWFPKMEKIISTKPAPSAPPLARSTKLERVRPACKPRWGHRRQLAVLSERPAQLLPPDSILPKICPWQNLR